MEIEEMIKLSKLFDEYPDEEFFTEDSEGYLHIVEGCPEQELVQKYVDSENYKHSPEAKERVRKVFEEFERLSALEKENNK